MRTAALLALVAGTPLLIGAGCLPIIDYRDNPPQQTVLGVAITAPAGNRAVASGSIVRIEYALVNRTGSDATVTLLVENQSDRVERELTEESVGGDATATRGFDWDTTGFASGEYVITARAAAAGRSSEADGPGRITINAAPTFTFTAPTADVTLEPEDTVTLSWRSADSDGDATITLSIDPDADHDSGNETEILRNRAAGTTETADSFEWGGRDADGNAVAGAAYRLFATVSDGVNEPLVVEAPARITTPNAQPTLAFSEPAQARTVDSGESVDIAWTANDLDGDDVFVTILFDDDQSPDETDDSTPPQEIVERQKDDDGSGQAEWDTTGVAPGTYFLAARVEDDVSEPAFVVHTRSVTIRNSAPTLEFTAPTEDTNFLAADANLTIEFTVTDEENDVLVTLRVDTDDDHANGNELTILLDRLVDAGESDEEFAWDGTSQPGGADVPNGIYRVLAVADDGENDPVDSVLGDALIFRRTDAGDPLVALLEPATPMIVDPGDALMIRWRDDTPTAGATLDLAVDDDRFPDELVETGEPEMDILTGRDANGDGLLDRFTWQVPTLDPGTYYVFARISNPGAADPHVSVATGTVIVRDPTQQ